MRNFWKGCASIIFNLRLYWFPAVKVPLAFRLKGSTLRQVAHHTISLSGSFKYASSVSLNAQQPCQYSKNHKMVHIDNYFLDPFDTLNTKILATISYILALPGCCVALGFIWYEASGRAGPYRTCINQLVSRLYLLVSFYCVFINFVDLIRVWNGPLPEFICTPMQVTRLGITMKGSFLLIVLSIMKTWIVCIRKSVPTMDDNFVVTFVTRASVMLSILYSSTLVILPQKPALAHVSPEINWLLSRNLYNFFHFSGFVMENMDPRNMN